MLSGQYPEPVREQDGQLLGRLSLVLHRLRPLLPDSRGKTEGDWDSAPEEAGTLLMRRS